MSYLDGSFPDMNIPKKDKDEDWHKKFATSILNQAIDSNYDLSYRMMQESYEYYDGTQESGELSFIQETEGGDTLPALWINYQSIRPKVAALIGECRAKGFDISVKAINKDAAASKLGEKHRLKGLMMIQDDLQQVQDETGMPVAIQEELPESDDELEDYITYIYKDDAENVMKAALKYLIKKYRWERVRISLFRDLLIAGRCFVKTDIVEGMVTYKRVDPRYMIFDTSVEDDFLSDATYYGHMEYMPLAEVKQRYKLTDKEIKDLGDPEGQQINNFLNIFNSNNYRVDSSNILSHVSGVHTDLKVLVFHCQFQDTDHIKRKVSKDKFGNTHYNKVKPNAKGKDIKNTRVKMWRKCTLIGGKIVKDWGLKKNMIRSIDDMYDTKSDYVGLAHNFVNGKTVSIVKLVEKLQDFKNIALYNLQLAMNRAGAKGFSYDVSQLPESWEFDDVLYYLKTTGITVYNSYKGGVQRGDPGIREFDMTMSQSVNQYINIVQMIDAEISSITGVSRERLGQVASASQAVGVTEASITSSQYVTEPIFAAFQDFSEEVFNQLAGLVKIVFQHNKEAFAPIIGDSGVDFIKNDVDLHLNDYGVFIDATPSVLQEEQKFEQLFGMALQSGMVGIQDAMDFLQERDVDYKVRKLKRVITKREEEKAAQEQAMAMQQQQAEAEAAQIAMQQQQQGLMMAEEAKGQRRQQEIDQTHNNRLQQDMVKESMKITKE